MKAGLWERQNETALRDMLVVESTELESWFSWGGEREDDVHVLDDVLNSDNWLVILPTNTKSIGHLHVLEKKFGFKNNEFEEFLELLMAASIQ